VAAYVPPGWPAGVHPPGSEGFEQTAVAWLLDVVPPDYRLHGVLRRHPVALAVLAKHHVAACVQGAREGYRTARTELGGDLPPGSVAAVLAAYRAEGSRLVGTARAVDLVGRALRGEVFTPQMSAPQREAPRQNAQRRETQPGGAPRQNAQPRNTGPGEPQGAGRGSQRQRAATPAGRVRPPGLNPRGPAGTTRP
jgi:hypothetical protein